MSNIVKQNHHHLPQGRGGQQTEPQRRQAGRMRGAAETEGHVFFCWYLFKISHNRNLFQLSKLWKEKDFQGFEIIEEVIKMCFQKYSR